LEFVRVTVTITRRHMEFCNGLFKRWNLLLQIMVHLTADNEDDSKRKNDTRAASLKSIWLNDCFINKLLSCYLTTY